MRAAGIEYLNDKDQKPFRRTQKKGDCRNWGQIPHARKKALETYPVIPSPYYGGDEDRNLKYRFGFVKGYDQAMQDFLEKAKEFFIEKHAGMFNQFKNYMQDV